jgi:hypothetical protein
MLDFPMSFLSSPTAPCLLPIGFLDWNNYELSNRFSLPPRGLFVHLTFCWCGDLLLGIRPPQRVFFFPGVSSLLFVATLGGGDSLLHDNFYPSLYLDY